MISVFQIVPDMPMSPIIDIPDTHFVLFWNSPDRAYEVRDVCGFTHRQLTRQARVLLRAENVASSFPKVGKMVQRYVREFAA